MKNAQGMGHGDWWERELEKVETLLAERKLPEEEDSPTTPEPVEAVWVLWWPTKKTSPPLPA